MDNTEYIKRKILCKVAVKMQKLLTISAVKDRLNCSKAYCYAIVQSGKLKAVKIPASKGTKRPLVRVRPEDLDAFIEAHIS